jgi:hypothetical protein
MRCHCCFSLLVWSALAPHLPAAVDLTRIDRSLRKEPVYQSKAPEYGLLVFGPKADVRVWVVLDGDALYIDRNGNGDLTDPGERLLPETNLHRPDFRPEVEVLRTFDLSRLAPGRGTGPLFSCLPQVRWFHLFQLVPREDYPDRDEVQFWKEQPVRVAVSCDGRYMQDVRLDFARRPQDAPVMHFNGPGRLVLAQKFNPRLTLRRGETTEMEVHLVTPGLNATVVTAHDNKADAPGPVAEIEWPPGRPGEAPIRSRIVLKEHC